MSGNGTQNRFTRALNVHWYKSQASSVLLKVSPFWLWSFDIELPPRLFFSFVQIKIHLCDVRLSEQKRGRPWRHYVGLQIQRPLWDTIHHKWMHLNSSLSPKLKGPRSGMTIWRTGKDLDVWIGESKSMLVFRPVSPSFLEKAISKVKV